MTEGALYFAAPHELNDTLEVKYDHAEPEDVFQAMIQTISEIRQQRGRSTVTFDSAGWLEMSKAVAREISACACSQIKLAFFGSPSSRPSGDVGLYYADNAQWFCFELAWPPEIMKQQQLLPADVMYSSQARVHNRAEAFRQIFLDLAAERPENSPEELQQITLDDAFRRKWGIYTSSRTASIKHTDWAHEQELRLLAPRFGALSVLSDVLTRVHFVRTDGENWLQIMQLLHTCEFSAYRSHFVVGVKAPPDCRRNGTTGFPA